MPPPSSPHVLIAGAGLGGLALAQALRKKGISYEIFERDNRERKRLGWVIGLHHMLDDLKESVPDDLPPISSLNNLLPLTKYFPECVYYDPEKPDQPKIGVRGDESEWVIRAARHRIVEWLETHIPVQYNKQLTKIEETDSKVKIHFHDGTSAEGDILVGAEGARSSTRKHILGGKDPIRAPAMAIIQGFCTLEGEELEEQLRLGHSLYVVDMNSINGSPMVLLVTLVEMYPDGKSGRIGWALIWPDERAIKEDFWVYSATGQEQYDYVIEKTKQLDPKYLTTIKRTNPQTLVPVLRLYTLTMDSMPTGRITLLGDAAHAMTPFRGEGGFHAISDALNLARAISKIDKDNVENIKEVFGPYQSEMLKRGGAAAKLSEEAFAKKRELSGSEFYVAWGRPMAILPEEHIE